jgi:stage II sporulation protein D
VYADVRDQYYAGWSKESGWGGTRWSAAVRATGSLVVRYGGQVVKAFYSSSSGGYTQSIAAWGGAPKPYYPTRRDPDDYAGGRNPNWRWSSTRSAASISALLGGYQVGAVGGLRVLATDTSGRVRRVEVTGAQGRVVVTGETLRRLLGLKSTRYKINAIQP